MDAWLMRMYERLGAAYVYCWFAVIAIVAMVIVGPGALALVASYEGASLPEWALALAAAELAALLTAPILLVGFRSELRALRRWSGGERTTELREQVEDAAFSMPRRFSRRLMTLGMVIVNPVACYALLTQTGNTTALDFIETAAGATILLLMAAVATLGALELALVPARRTLDRRTRPPGSETNLAMNLVAGTVALVYTTGAVALCVNLSREQDGAGSLGVAIVVTLAATSLMALILWPLVSGTVVIPIRDLMRGTRSVSDGALAASVPVTSRDELGELAESFNEMIDGLHEREVLRGRNVELVDELQASRARIVSSSDDARRRVERDLHDGAQQSLVLLNLKLGLAERQIATDPDRAREMLGESRADLDRALAELRDLAHGIYPQVLTSDGLPGALAEIAGLSGLEVELSLEGAGRYPPELEAAIYFCCLEALQNAGKYAGEGARVRVALSEANGELRFEVADDGIGFDPASVNGSAGLQNMADRMGALEGELRIESSLGGGTKVAGSVPVR